MAGEGHKYPPFPKDKFQFTKIPCKEANEIVVAKHYLHRPVYTGRVIAYKVTMDDCPETGVITFGFPVFCRKKNLVGPGAPLANGELVDLTRMYMPDGFPYNTESFVISKSLKMLKGDWHDLTGLTPRAIITMADREFTHQGTIYKATNFTHLGFCKGRKAKPGEKHGRWDVGEPSQSTAKNARYNAKNIPGERKEVFLLVLDSSLKLDIEVLRKSYRQELPQNPHPSPNGGQHHQGHNDEPVDGQA